MLRERRTEHAAQRTTAVGGRARAMFYVARTQAQKTEGADGALCARVCEQQACRQQTRQPVRRQCA